MPKLFVGIVIIIVVALGGYALTREDTPSSSPEPSPTISPEEASPTPSVSPSPSPTPEEDAMAPENTPLPVATESASPTPSGPVVEAFVITADDDTYAPDGPILVTTNSTVHIRFEVSEENVYFGGLQFRGGPVDTGTIEPGGTGEVSFTASEDFTITAYWPASGVVKYRIPVVVQ